MQTTTLAYVTLFAPLAAAGLITAFSLRNKTLATALAWLGIGAGAVCSLLMAQQAFGYHEKPYSVAHQVVWLESGGITISSAPRALSAKSETLLMSLRRPRR